MRARVIDEWTADVSSLFDRLHEFCGEAVTVGIGDGGNEIGMGAVPWEELVARLPGEDSDRIPCRIATDWNLLAGISNWGAWGLAAAVAVLADRVELLSPLTLDWQRELVARLVADGPGVDGPSGRPVVGVDGLGIDDYLEPWEEIRELLGLLGVPEPPRAQDQEEEDPGSRMEPITLTRFFGKRGGGYNIYTYAKVIMENNSSM